MRKTLGCYFLLLLFWALPSFAQLTPACMTSLKAAFAADPTATAFINVGQYAQVASLYNAAASPSFTTWKTNVTMMEIGKKVNGSELGGLTTANHTRLQTIIQISAGSINPSLPDQRAFFDDVFSGAGGTTTRANLLALWKRLATKAEKVCATGTGSDASPATLTFEGNLTATDVESILIKG